MPKESKLTSSDLRKKLFTVMEDTMNGKMDLSRATQSVKAASQITCSLRTDIEERRLNLKLIRSQSKSMKL